MCGRQLLPSLAYILLFSFFRLFNVWRAEEAVLKMAALYNIQPVQSKLFLAGAAGTKRHSANYFVLFGFEDNRLGV